MDPAAALTDSSAPPLAEGLNADALKAFEAAADAAGLCCARADAPDKAGVLAQLARGLKFPSHFGGNWDALADCLADPGTDARRLVVVAASALADLPRERAVLEDVLREAARDVRAPRLFVAFEARGEPPIKNGDSSVSRPI